MVGIAIQAPVPRTLNNEAVRPNFTLTNLTGEMTLKSEAIDTRVIEEFLHVFISLEKPRVSEVLEPQIMELIKQLSLLPRDILYDKRVIPEQFEYATKRNLFH